MRKIIYLTALLHAPISVFAKDCVLVPDLSLCGVPLNAAMNTFVKAIGKPDGSINMGPDRLGLLYGQKLMLIFWHNKIWQVHSWETNPNIDFWDYVRNKAPYEPFVLKINELNPWGLTRKQLGIKAKNLPVLDEDQFSEIRTAVKTQIAIFYAPTWNASDNPEDWGAYPVNHIRVSFGEVPPPP